MSQSSIASTAHPTSSATEANRGEVQLRGLRLRFLQALWLVLVLIDLATLIVSLPGYYHTLFTLCPGPVTSCPDTGQLSAQTLPTLLHAGFSLNTYAFYVIFLDALTTLSFLLIGALIIWRRANTWMGLFVSFLLIEFGSLGLSFAHTDGFPNVPSNLLLNILNIALFIPTILYYPCLSFFFSTFPDGRFVPRWSWALIGLWVVNTFFWLASASPGSPFGIANWPPLLEAGWLSVVFGGSACTQLYRYLRVASPNQRQQIKWLLYGFVPVLVGPLCLTLYMTFVPSLNQPGAYLINTPNSFFLIVTLPLYRFWYLPVPFCIGIALLRYRLWDIDLIINRTLVYGILTASVIGVYVLAVNYFSTLLRTGNNPAISLLATAIVAVLFQPLRNLLQRGVNRLMYGERDDPYAVLARLGSRLEATLVPEKVLPTIVDTVAQALKLPYVAIALLPEQHSFTATTAGTAGALSVPEAKVLDIVASSGMPTPDTVQMPLVYQAETVGYLLLAARSGDTFGKADTRLLADLARQAGVAVYAVRLTTHLQHLTVSLQQARERLVTTREEERRRLRRDLHDGLGPALASLTFKVDAARNLLKTDRERTETLLAGVRQQAQDAITDIRRLVHNLRPPALDEFGLLSALREQAAHYQHQGLEVVFDMPEALPPLPAAVEVAAYRITQEALTNVARHAQAQHCLLDLSIDAGVLHLDISDDGKGIPPGHHSGVGLHAMHERASELGGSCTITRGSSGGTTIQVRLPLPAAEEAGFSSAQYTTQQEHAPVRVADVHTAPQQA
jgi:signal transduction histidine kinase